MPDHGKFRNNINARRQWPTEDVESYMPASLAVGFLSMTLKYGLYLSFPLYVAMVVVGLSHRKDCPVNKRIPWYLFFGKLIFSKTLLKKNFKPGHY